MGPKSMMCLEMYGGSDAATVCTAAPRPVYTDVRRFPGAYGAGWNDAYLQMSSVGSSKRRDRAGTEADGNPCVSASSDPSSDSSDSESDSFPPGQPAYVWEQQSFNALTGDAVCNMHFAFPNCQFAPCAFSYDWRLWTAAEIREAMLEVGFSRVVLVYADFSSDADDAYRLSTDGSDIDPAVSWSGWIIGVNDKPLPAQNTRVATRAGNRAD
eukprot:gnl/Ergobibamus_cyprinoides/1441.p1 GENE.gnl/Ergobibamus_cyprinoides/1441~~gnl/Ergobibamus_cyprinoides/1441.p1  ORF type:complete len:212 (+),score=13.66 gnl/Ergobibamus_cyprinoides/1441:264-899(+)